MGANDPYEFQGKLVWKKSLGALFSDALEELLTWVLGINCRFPLLGPKKLEKESKMTTFLFSTFFEFFFLEGREPPLTLRRENQYLYFGRFVPCTPGPFSCSTGLFVYHSHRAGPVLQEFGLVLRVGVRHSTSVLRPLPGG